MGGLVTPHAHEPDDTSESLRTTLFFMLMDSSFRKCRQIRLESLRCILLESPIPLPFTPSPIEFLKTATMSCPPISPYCMNFYLY